MSNIDGALNYAGMGWYVIPIHWCEDGKCSCGKPDCKSKGKHPFAKLAPNGLKNATIDPELIKRWWGQYPKLNIGILCGQQSGIWCLDLDNKVATDGSTGLTQFDHLQFKHNEDVKTAMTAKTPTGGVHLIFSYDDRIKTTANILPKIDIRSDASYFVAAPSTIDGKEYYWWEDEGPGERTPEPAPDWLINELLPRPKNYVLHSDSSLAKQNLNSETVVAEGGRNDYLMRFGCSLLAKGISGEALLSKVLDENKLSCSPPLDLDEVKYIVSGISKRYKPGFSEEIVKKIQVPVVESVEAKQNFPMSDVGNMKRMMAACGDNVRWVPAWKQWLVFSDEHGWAIDSGGSVVKTIAIEMTQAMAAESDDKAWQRFCMVSQSDQKLNAMVNLLKTQCSLSDSLIERHPGKIKLANGIFDLDQMQMIQFSESRNIYMLKASPITYKPETKCPLWEETMAKIFESDPEMIDYIQKLFGYCLTGYTTEQALFYFYGEGNNGKSTMLGVLRRILGDYYVSLPAEAITKKRFGGDDPFSIVGLFGARLAQTNEPNEGDWLDESKIKLLTGGDSIRARNLHQSFFDFDPTHKQFLLGNHKLGIRGTDDGIWRRMRLIGCLAKLGDDPTKKAYDLQIFNAESSGVFNWMIEGYFRYRCYGLAAPNPIKTMTDEYQNESDPVYSYIDERIIFDEFSRTESIVIFQDYVTYCEQRRTTPKSESAFFKVFSKWVKKFGYAVPTRDKKVRFWSGIRLA